MATHDLSIAHLEQHMEAFRRLIEVGFSQGDVSMVDEIFAPDFVEHQAGVVPPNREGVKGLVAYLHQAMPDLSIVVADIAAYQDKVWARLIGRGTHNGPFMGVPPTGRAITVEIIDICRFKGGKIVEHWGYTDRLAALEQLGAAAQESWPRA